MTSSDTALAASAAFVRAAEQLTTYHTLTDLEILLLDAMADAEERGEDPTDALAGVPQIEEALAQKLDAILSLVRNFEHVRDGRKAEADRLTARAKTADRAAEWLRNRIKQHMELTGQQRIETARFTVRLQRNSQPSVVVLEEQMVPRQFIRTVITESVDKVAILASVKSDGAIPPGVDIVHGQHVRIS